MMRKLQLSLIVGCFAAVAMTLFLKSLNLIGYPAMFPPQSWAKLLSTSLLNGWLVHILIGVIYVLLYQISPKIQLIIRDITIRGLFFGLVTLFIAQFSWSLIEGMVPSYQSPSNDMLIMMSSLIGHLLFGLIAVHLTQWLTSIFKLRVQEAF